MSQASACEEARAGLPSGGQEPSSITGKLSSLTDMQCDKVLFLGPRGGKSHP